MNVAGRGAEAVDGAPRTDQGGNLGLIHSPAFNCVKMAWVAGAGVASMRRAQLVSFCRRKQQAASRSASAAGLSQQMYFGLKCTCRGTGKFLVYVKAF